MRKVLVIALLALTASAYADGFLGIEWGKSRNYTDNQLLLKGYTKAAGTTITAVGVQMEAYAGTFSGDPVRVGVGFSGDKLVSGIILYKGDHYTATRSKYERQLTEKYGKGNGFFDKVWYVNGTYISLPDNFMDVWILYVESNFYAEYSRKSREAEKDDF